MHNDPTPRERREAEKKQSDTPYKWEPPKKSPTKQQRRAWRGGKKFK